MQDTVHGVTTEECQAALQNHGWSVQRAIQYLKVPHAPVPLPWLPREAWYPVTPLTVPCPLAGGAALLPGAEVPR